MKMNLPFAIIVTGLIVSGGIFVSKYESKNIEVEVAEVAEKIIEIQPVTPEDNIIGNPNAQIVIIEYSDFQCPFCQEFHFVMQKIMERYAMDGKVAWVYRHMPAVNVYPFSKQAALASECVKSLGNSAGLNGNSLFWKFSDLLFLDVPTSLTLENMGLIAETIGIDKNELAVCISSERHLEKIEKHITDVIKLSEVVAEIGTPFNIVMTKNGDLIPINGTETYERMVDLIEILLTQ